LAAATGASIAVIMLEAFGALETVNGLLRPGLTARPSTFWMLLSLSGSLPVMVAVLLALIVLQALRGDGLDVVGAGALASIIVAVLVVEPLKVVMGVPRPGYDGVQPAGILGLLTVYSFPSGHAARASALACYSSRKGLAWAIPLWLWAFAVALSRVILGAHWLSDVLGGLALGAWASSLTWVLEGRWAGAWNDFVGGRGLLALRIRM